MITDEERREVARKLRELPIDMYELARKLEAEGTMSSGGEETDWSQIHDAMFGCWPPPNIRTHAITRTCTTASPP